MKAHHYRQTALLLAMLVASSVSFAGERVKTWEGTITLPTYPWTDGANPQFSALGERIIYPYAMQDDLSKDKTDRTYRALYLENEYLKVTCLPELGGRIHSVFDKTEGKEMFHINDAIKPALIAMRGAWISGGIEWNFGPHGHTVTAVSPVDALTIENEDGSATLVVGNTEKIFRTRWTVRLTLHPGKAYLDEVIRIFNPTDGIHPYYFWNCTAFPNRKGTRFIYPMTLGSDHNGEKFFSWPTDNGKDLTYLKNYPVMTSVFAYKCVFDFFGAYDVDADRGIVQYANHHEVKGKKAWTWGQDGFGLVSQMALSDAGPEGAPYIEVQSGPLLTQADYGMLLPRREITWREWWYPVHGLGEGYEFATKDVAIQTARNNGALDIRMIATGVFDGAACTVSRSGQTLIDQEIDLSPMAAAKVTLPDAADDPVRIAIRSRDGEVLASFTSPLPVPRVEKPDLTKHFARSDGRATAEELYFQAHKLDSQTAPAAAREMYEKVLEEDPGHVPSLRALAVLDLEQGLDARAAERLETALDRDPDDGLAWYWLGVAHLRLGHNDQALDCGYKAARTLDAVSIGYDLVGRARMRMGQPEAAAMAFGKAIENHSTDTRARDHRLIADYALGHRKKVREASIALIEKNDPSDMIPRALAALTGGEEDMDAFFRESAAIFGEDEFTLLETSLVFADLGLYGEAQKLLQGSMEGEGSPFKADSLLSYYLAYYNHKMGDRDADQRHLDQAAAMDAAGVFPSRPETIPVLEHAIASNPGDAHAHLLLGNLYAGLQRLDEAAPQWAKAAELDSGLSVAWRNLGLHAWHKKRNPAQAEKFYRKAIEARPGDQVLYYDLARILTEENKRPEAIELVESVLNQDDLRADLLLWLARAYLDDTQYDRTINLLMSASFSNWEGRSTPRELFVRAHLERGKQDFSDRDYTQALDHFSAALTYPDNLEVGRKDTDEEAEAYYWKGRALKALGRREEARRAWSEGAAGPEGSEAQNKHRDLCRTALELTSTP